MNVGARSWRGMGWRWQGRQYHQWFGHGTKPDDGSGGVGTLEERIRNLGYTALAMVPERDRRHPSATFDEARREQLTRAMRAWTAGADLPPDTFANRYFDTPPSAAAVREFQAAARLTRDARSLADVHDATEALANGMQTVGLDGWPGFLAEAADRARSADLSTVVKAERPRPYYGPDSLFIPGSPSNQAAVRDAEATVEAIRRQLRALMGASEEVPAPLPGMTDPAEIKPPRDARDRYGAKAPGKPTEAEGFRDPKGGEQWVKNPNGKGYGWLAENGEVWVPTGYGPDAHGGEHWDVQDPRTGKHRNVYPPRPDADS
jgi:hypothetical protein